MPVAFFIEPDCIPSDHLPFHSAFWFCLFFVYSQFRHIHNSIGYRRSIRLLLRSKYPTYLLAFEDVSVTVNMLSCGNGERQL